MGRVLNCLLALTDPTATVYAAELGPGWFTLEPDKSNQVCGIETFATLKRCAKPKRRKGERPHKLQGGGGCIGG